jgi:hypothetical protein
MQLTEIEKSEAHKHERVVYLMNDCLIVTKLTKSGKKHFKSKFLFENVICTTIPAIASKEEDKE